MGVRCDCLAGALPKHCGDTHDDSLVSGAGSSPRTNDSRAGDSETCRQKREETCTEQVYVSIGTMVERTSRGGDDEQQSMSETC